MRVGVDVEHVIQQADTAAENEHANGDRNPPPMPIEVTDRRDSGCGNDSGRDLIILLTEFICRFQNWLARPECARHHVSERCLDELDGTTEGNLPRCALEDYSRALNFLNPLQQVNRGTAKSTEQVLTGYRLPENRGRFIDRLRRRQRSRVFLKGLPGILG